MGRRGVGATAGAWTVGACTDRRGADRESCAWRGGADRGSAERKGTGVLAARVRGVEAQGAGALGARHGARGRWERVRGAWERGARGAEHSSPRTEHWSLGRSTGAPGWKSKSVHGASEFPDEALEPLDGPPEPPDG